MSQQEETVVGIVTLPAQGLSKHAAVAKMSIDFPDATVRGIQPEPVDGNWVGIIEKKAVKVEEDNNTGLVPPEDGASGFDHDIDSLDLQPDSVDVEDHPDEEEDKELISQMVGDKLDEILRRLDALEGKDEDEGMDFDRDMTEGRFESRDWGGDDMGDLDETPVAHEQEKIRNASTIKVNRDRTPGMTIKQARTELTKEASTHPKLKNYQIIDIDVSSDGSRFEATLAPKQRRRRGR